MIIDFTKSIFYVENYGFDVPTDAITLAYDELFTNCFLVYMDLLSKGFHKRIEYKTLDIDILNTLVIIGICASMMVSTTLRLTLILRMNVRLNKLLALTTSNIFTIKCVKMSILLRRSNLFLIKSLEKSGAKSMCETILQILHRTIKQDMMRLQKAERNGKSNLPASLKKTFVSINVI